MQPQSVVKPLKTKRFSRQRHFLAVFFISFMWGTFGVDRWYLGKIWTGVLKLVTFGGFGLWTIVDLLLIMNGTMRDAWGRPMLEFREYKRFAYMTVLIFALVLGVIILVNGIVLIVAVSQFMTDFQSGGIDSILKTLPGGTQLPEDLQGYY